MDTLKQLFEKTMTSVIEFRLGLSTFEYENKQLLENWRKFENELDEKNNPINGIEVKINGEDLQKWGEEICNDAIILERAIERGGITTTLAGEPFRYEEMSFVYLFSILEDFGNSILKIKNPDYYDKEIENKGKSWHSKINQYNKEEGKDLNQILVEIFDLEKHLNINGNIISEFIRLKTVRNDIVHQLKYLYSSNFKDDIDNIIVIMCYLYYINDNNIEEFSIFPLG